MFDFLRRLIVQGSICQNIGAQEPNLVPHTSHQVLHFETTEWRICDWVEFMGNMGQRMKGSA